MSFGALMETLRLLDIVDILVVTIMGYYIYILIRNTRAMALVKGLLVLGVINFLAHIFELHAISWLLQQGMAVLIVALPIVFQPELRRILEQLGSAKLLSSSAKITKDEFELIVREVTLATRSMARRKVGALIVFERNVKLDVISMQGTRIDGIISSELLMNIFYPKSPLHDGAVIIRNGRIETAASLLPVSQNRSVNKELGTRHRAALGQSEESDALVVIVSEETGQISYALGGHIYRDISEDTLRNTLISLIDTSSKSKVSSIWDVFKRKKGE